MPEKLVNIVTPEGIVTAVPESKANQLQATGDARTESNIEAITRQGAVEEERQFADTDDKIRALGQGILSSMTLGLSDFGFDDAAGQAKHNRAFRVGGELLGLGASLAGSTGSVGASLLSPGSALFKASTAAGRRLGGRSALKRGVVEGLVDGAGSGVAATISNAALHDTPLTVESIAAGAGTGALLGGGVGGLFGATQKLVTKRATAEAAEKVNPFFNPKGKGSKSFASGIDDHIKAIDQEVALNLKSFKKARRAEPDLLATAAERPQAIADNVIDGAIPALRKEYGKAKNEMLSAMGAKDGAFSFDKFVKSPPKAALKAAQKLDEYKAVLGRIDNELGTAHAAKLDGLIPQVSPLLADDVQSALGKLIETDPVELAVAAKLDPKAVQALTPDAQQLLSTYALGRAGVESQAQAVVKNFRKWVDKSQKAHKQTSPLLQKGMNLAAMAPYALVPELMAFRMGQVGGQVLAKGSKVLAKFVSTGKKAPAIRRFSSSLVSKEVSGKILFDMPDEERPKTSNPLHQRMAEVRFAAANPQHLRDQVETSLSGLFATNSEMGFRLADLIESKIGFLASKAPQAPDDNPFMRSRWQPSATQMSEWARYLESTEDPMGRLEKELNSGNISVQLVETLQTLYPTLYDKLQRDTIDMVTENPGEYSYTTRIALSTLFQTPLDPAAGVSFGRAMQTLQSSAEQGATQGIPVSPTALRENVQNTMTKGQKLTER